MHVIRKAVSGEFLYPGRGLRFAAIAQPRSFEMVRKVVVVVCYRSRPIWAYMNGALSLVAFLL